MKTINRIYRWAQVIISVFVIAYMGVFQLVRSIIIESDIFYKLCFAAIIFVGMRMMLLPSIAELREALKPSNNEPR